MKISTNLFTRLLPVLLVLSLLLGACQPVPNPTPSPEAMDTSVPQASPTAAPPMATATLAATNTPSATPTPQVVTVYDPISSALPEQLTQIGEPYPVPGTETSYSDYYSPDWVQIIFHSDAVWVAVVQKDMSIRILDMDTGEEVVVLQNDDLTDIDLLFASPDNRFLALASAVNETLRIWDMDSLEMVRELNFTGFEYIWFGHFSEDNNYLVLVEKCKSVQDSDDCRGSSVIVFDLGAGREVEKLVNYQTVTLSVAFIPGTHLLAIAGLGDKGDDDPLTDTIPQSGLIIWDWDVHQPEMEFLTIYDLFYENVAASSDGSILAAYRGDVHVPGHARGLFFLDTQTWEPKSRSLGIGRSWYSFMQFLPETKAVVTLEVETRNSYLRIADSSLPQPAYLRGAGGVSIDVGKDVLKMYASPNGRFLYITTQDSDNVLNIQKWGVPRVVTITQETDVSSLTGTPPPPTATSFFPTQMPKLMLTPAAQNPVASDLEPIIWQNLDRLQLLWEPFDVSVIHENADAPIQSYVSLIHRSGNVWLAYVPKEYTYFIYLVDLQSGEQIAVLDADAPIDGLGEPSPDGRWLPVFDLLHKRIRVWDLDRLEEVRELPMDIPFKVNWGQENVFSDDGRYLVVTGCVAMDEYDICVKTLGLVYDMESGEIVRTIDLLTYLSFGGFQPGTYNLVLLGDDDPDAVVLNIETGKTLLKMSADEQNDDMYFASVGFTPDGKRLILQRRVYDSTIHTARVKGEVWIDTQTWEVVDETSNFQRVQVAGFLIDNVLVTRHDTVLDFYQMNSGGVITKGLGLENTYPRVSPNGRLICAFTNRHVMALELYKNDKVYCWGVPAGASPVSSPTPGAPSATAPAATATPQAATSPVGAAPSATSPASTPTSEAPPTSTPIPTAIQEPASSSADLFPGLSLNPALTDHFVLPGYNGLWSPGYDELGGIFTDEDGWEQVGIATAPDFLLKAPGLDDLELYYASTLWGVDGRNLVFSTSGDYSVEGELWRVDRKGQTLQPVAPDVYGLALFPDNWMDERKLVTTAYSGGGHSEVNIIDFLSGKVLARGLVHGPVFEPSHSYVPMANENIGRFMQMAMGLQPADEPSLLVENEYALVIPNEAVGEILPQADTVFRDWLPGTNQMLVYAFSHTPWEIDPPEMARLLLWDVDSGEISDVLPNGVDGRYSADGRWLGGVTLGPVLVEGEKLALGPAQAIPAETQPHLALIETASGRVLLNLPVSAVVRESMEVAPFPDYLGYFTFSTDSRYLAFVTPGEVQTDAAGKPVSVQDGEETYLNVFDTQSGKLIFSQAAAERLPRWAPRSNRLAYLAADGNWQLFDPAANTTTPLTTTNEDRIWEASWSQSGRYLALYAENEDGRLYTIVFLFL